MRNDGEDSAVDSVKLIEATPSAATRKSFQELRERAWDEEFWKWINLIDNLFRAVVLNSVSFAAHQGLMQKKFAAHHTSFEIF